MTDNNFQDKFENIELGELFEELIRCRIDHKGGIHINEIRDDLVDYHLGITKDLLTKKDQEHKAELEMINNRLNGQLDERSMMDGTIYLSDAKQAVSDIFDSHINKLSTE